MARQKPLSALIMVTTILAYLLFVAGRCATSLSLAPIAMAVPVTLVLSLITWGTWKAPTLAWFGAGGIAYVIALQAGAMLNMTGIDRPLIWLLPTALVIPLCGAPFWITRTHCTLATLASYCMTVPYTLMLPLTREETIVACMWFAIGVPMAFALHFIFYGYRLQHFVLEGRLADLAATDPLTGVPNRRDFLERAQAILRESDRAGEPTSAVYLDVDDFKTVNDSFGHATGDRLLKGVASTLMAETRAKDLVGRVGGEEFAMLITSCGLQDALDLAERMRTALGTIRRPDGRLSASLGVAEHAPGESLFTLLDRADQAMLDAKRLGRNRVEVAVTPPRLGSSSMRPEAMLDDNAPPAVAS
jgi:diguanylate cyclase (GGDEF)-like protein